jgi:hypothetical protein
LRLSKRLAATAAVLLPAGPAAAHHSEGADGGLGWIWVFVGVVFVLVGVAAWALLSNGTDDAGG